MVAFIFYFKQFIFSCVCVSSMITIKLFDHDGNEAKSSSHCHGVVGVHVLIFSPPSQCPSESNAVIVPTLLSKTQHSINHRSRHFHRQSAPLPRSFFFCTYTFSPYKNFNKNVLGFSIRKRSRCFLKYSQKLLFCYFCNKRLHLAFLEIICLNKSTRFFVAF